MPASMLSAATWKSGTVTYPGPAENFVGGHAVLFCGYDDATKRLTFMNSWGEGWATGLRLLAVRVRHHVAGERLLDGPHRRRVATAVPFAQHPHSTLAG
jgi:hypothetical protein